MSLRPEGRVPQDLHDHVLAGQQPGFLPYPVRDAATVALVRDAPGGMQVYLLRRVAGMAFAGGMHVFPGGSVDRADATADIAWAGSPPAAWAADFGTDEPMARALVCAAVRETFEESGVLLAGPAAGEVLADVSTDEWEAERADLEARAFSLSELLARRGLVLRADLLRPLAHWITPVVEPRRFDTRFFLAEVPSGQVCRDAGSEADQRVWIRPRDALDQGVTLLPPTAAVLEELAAYDDVAGALAAPRTVLPVLPRLMIADSGEVALLMPGQPGHEGP
ncbi:MAG: hydrolase [Frankiales bacterium]|nr:hydrolase [Frankiales bacterium]